MTFRPALVRVGPASSAALATAGVVRRRPDPRPHAEIATPPDALRRFDAADWPVADPVGAWRCWGTARRDWEAQHGVTFAEMRAARLAGASTLDELNACYSPRRHIADDRPDPRWAS